MERDSKRIVKRLSAEGWAFVSAKGSHRHRSASEEGFAGWNGAQHRPHGGLGSGASGMKTYLALVHKDDDSAYGVSFPDLPGCFSAADDYADLLRNAAEALALWFDDQPETTPRGVEAIRAEVADDLREGAFLVAVPHVRRSTKQRRVNVSLDAGTLDAIDTAARGMRLTRSAFIAMAAANEITGLRRDQPCRRWA